MSSPFRLPSLRLFAALLAGILLAGVAGGGASPSRADSPVGMYAFPAGAQAGTATSVRFGGLYFHGQAPLRIFGPGVAASPQVAETDTIWFEGPVIPQPPSQRNEDYPRDHAAQLTVAADAPPGLRYWSVATSQGVTSHLPLVVGRLPELVEHEVDGPAEPVAVQLPVTVNGRIFPREDVDIWEFSAEGGQTIHAAVQAAALGSPLQARIEITDIHGRRLAENAGHFGIDPLIRFTAPATGRYQLRITDSDFGGLQHYVYRLTLTAHSFVDAIYPLGGRRGSQVRLEFPGSGLDAPAVLTLDEPTLAAQAIPDCRTPVDPLSQSVSASVVQLAIPGSPASWPVRFELDDLPELLKQPSPAKDEAPDSATIAAENNAAAALSRDAVWACPQPLTLSAPGLVCNGRIDRPGEADAWPFELVKGERWKFDVRAARLDSQLDGVLTIVDSQGKVLAQADDVGGQTDPYLEFAPPADGRYVVRVADRFAGRGGPRFAYRLRVTPAPGPDFALAVPLDTLTVFRDGEAKLRIDVERSGGFAAPIKLDFPGLPAGVTVVGPGDKLEIPAKAANVQITFKAAADARIGVQELTIRGQAVLEPPAATKKTGETAPAEASETPEPVTLTRTALCLSPPPARSPNAAPSVGASFPHLLLAVGMPTPFTFRSTYLSVYAPRGSTYRKDYVIERNGYDGPLEVQLADRQARHLQGVVGQPLTVPAGADSFTYAVQLPPFLEIGRTSRTTLMALAEVEDADGTRHKVSFSSANQNEQMVVLADPGLMSVRCPPSLRVGEEWVELPVTLQRAPVVRGPVRVELVLPAHLDGWESQSVELPLGQASATLQIRRRPAEEAPVAGAGTIASDATVSADATSDSLQIKAVVRASCRQGDDLFVDETSVELTAR